MTRAAGSGSLDGMAQSAGPGIVSILAEVVPWVLVALLVFNMSQRRYMDVGVGKRYATLQVAGLVAVLWATVLICRHFRAPDIILLPVAAVVALIAVLRRKSMFPYRLRCSSCGSRLPIGRILYHDDPRCSACAAAREDREEQP